MSGAKKSDSNAELETIAQKEFFQEHFAELASQAFSEFEKLTGRKYRPFDTYKMEDAKQSVISYGKTAVSAKAAVDNLRDKKSKVGSVKLNILFPQTEESVSSSIRISKDVVLLELISAKQICFNTFKCLTKTIDAKFISIQYGEKPCADDISAAVESVANTDKDNFYLNIDLTRGNSDFPKHAILLDNINRSYPNAQEKTLRTKGLTESKSAKDMDIPLALRQYKDNGPGYSSVSRFYNENGLFSKTGQTDQFSRRPISGHK